MCEAEARESRGVVEDCGLVFCAEARGESVPSLSGGVVHAVDQGGDGGWSGCWGAWGEGMGLRGGAESVEC